MAPTVPIHVVDVKHALRLYRPRASFCAEKGENGPGTVPLYTRMWTSSALPTVSAVRQPTWMRAHLLVRHHPLVDSAHAPAPLPETAPFLGAEWDRVALLQQSGVRYLSSGTECFFFCGREAKNRSQGGAAALRLQCHLHAIATKKITITSVIRNFFRSSSLNHD